MKRLFILLLLIPNLILAQKKPVKKAPTKQRISYAVQEDPTRETFLTEKDFGFEAGQVHSNRREMFIKDGSEKTVSTPFLFSGPEEKFKTLGLQKLNIIIHTSNFSAILKMKNKYTYQPRKISLFYSENSSNWVCAVEYTAQNDYGATKDGKIFYTYTDTGAEIDEIRE